METPVTFDCEGQQIVGMWHVPEGRTGPVPAVLFVHGFTGDRIEPFRVFVLTARRLAEQGIASLRIDCRGSGDSAGNFEDMTVSSELEDVSTALAWLRSRDEVDTGRIGILGFSMGGMVAAFTLGRDPEIRAAALWSPVGEPKVQIAQRAYPGWEADLHSSGVVTTEAWKLGPAFVKEMGRLEPLEAIRGVTCPILLVHGDHDESVNVQSSWLYEEALAGGGADVVVHIVAGADHTYTTVPWQEDLQTTTVAWFSNRLG